MEECMNIIVFGSEGKMGRVTAELIQNSAHTLAAKVDTLGGDGVYRSIFDCNTAADAIIDFSTHEATRELVGFLLGHIDLQRTVLVTAVTGRDHKETELIKLCSEKLPVFASANMSLGAALLDGLVETLASKLPEADVEIIETHRKGKLDIPSGTALELAKTIGEARARGGNTIIHSLRLGNTIGRHEVIFDDGLQTLTVSHSANSRTLFASGAIAAAEFVFGKPPGLYTMRDLIGD